MILDHEAIHRPLPTCHRNPQCAKTAYGTGQWDDNRHSRVRYISTVAKAIVKYPAHACDVDHRHLAQVRVNGLLLRKIFTKQFQHVSTNNHEGVSPTGQDTRFCSSLICLVRSFLPCFARPVYVLTSEAIINMASLRRYRLSSSSTPS